MIFVRASAGPHTSNRPHVKLPCTEALRASRPLAEGPAFGFGASGVHSGFRGSGFRGSVSSDLGFRGSGFIGIRVIGFRV